MGKGVAVVIGASRGIGAALCQVFHDNGYKVYGAVRRAPEVLDSTVLSVEGVDLANDSAAEPVLKALGDDCIDVLAVVAGCQDVDTLETVSKGSVRQQFEVNAIGPLFMVKALQHKLRRGGKVVLFSSKNGSITEVEATGGELYGYRMSKVALNMAGVTLAGDLKKAEISVALIHPGVVNTVMLRTLRETRGVPKDKLTANTLTPEESAARVWRLIGKMDLENSGTFWAADTGTPLRY